MKGRVRSLMIATVLILTVLMIVIMPVMASEEITATRDISTQVVSPGDTFTVTVVINANGDVYAPILDEDVPTNWVVTEVENAGATYKASKIKWLWVGMLSAGTSKTVIYNVSVPSDAAEGHYLITGTISAYGVDATAVGGECNVTVSAPLAAEANGPYYAVVDEPVQFLGSATGGTPPYEWLWDFGDGNSSTLQNPAHTYTTPNTYTATLTVTDNASVAATDTADVVVTETEVAPLTATRTISKQIVSPAENFTVSVTIAANKTVYAPILDENLPDGWVITPVQNDGATYKPTEVKWLWTETLSAGASKAVIYNVTVPSDSSEGDYWITGNVSAYGVNTTVIGGDSKVTVSIEPVPLTAEADGPYFGMVNEPITFYGSATGGTPPYEWLWDFGDGNTSTEQNPMHAYAAANGYVVTLKVTDSENAISTDTADVTVSSTGIVLPPTATRDISKQTVAFGESFTVTVVVNANQEVYAPILDEDVPEGWTVTEVDNGGASYKPSEVKWLWVGKLSQGETKTVVYEVTVPADAEEGTYYITGNISAYGTECAAVNGESEVRVVEKSLSPCLIATATYGTPLHEDIGVLREFRDEYLMTNPVGREFVRVYYAASPPIADVIRENEGLRRAVREGLVKPLVYIARIVVW